MEWTIGRSFHLTEKLFFSFYLFFSSLSSFFAHGSRSSSVYVALYSCSPSMKSGPRPLVDGKRHDNWRDDNSSEIKWLRTNHPTAFDCFRLQFSLKCDSHAAICIYIRLALSSSFIQATERRPTEFGACENKRRNCRRRRKPFCTPNTCSCVPKP